LIIPFTSKTLGPTHRGRTLRNLLLAVAVVVPLLISANPASAATDEPWVFEGGGWGHGVGMSQFGAKGQAEEGRSPAQILGHYFTGTGIGSVSAGDWTNNSDGLWIGIAPNTEWVTLSAIIGPVTVCLPADACTTSQTINLAETWRFEVNPKDPSQCRLRWVGKDFNTGWDTCSASISGISPNNRVSVNGTQYARGAVRFDPSSKGFHAVVTIDLERYLYGLAEVPFSWHSSALRAQAISGRSYAVATARQHGGANGTAKRAICGCHLLSTVLDQVYIGYNNESKQDANRWVSAVNATTSDVVIYNNTTIKTFYSSSNGGASENVEDVFGGPAHPYLRSVDDPWSANTNINPLAKWSVKVDGADLAKEFGWDEALEARILQGPPGVLIEFVGAKGGQLVTTVRNGTQIRAILGKLGFGYQPVLGGNTSVRVSPYISRVTAPPAFLDIVGHLFENDIEWLAREDITRGCNPPDNNLFCPNDVVTRGQMAAFLNRFLNLPPATRDHFTDDNGSTFESDINRLAEAGVTRGCNPPANDRFCPNDRVSREQMAAFIVRALELTENTHPGFNDVRSSNTFVNDIGKLATAGVTRGCNPPANTNFCPKDHVTRGQMAAFLHRSDELRS
jgi:hypothetical protein